MPIEIDIAKLREDYKDFEGVEIPFHLHDAIRTIPALLDEIEDARQDVADAMLDKAIANSLAQKERERAEAAEAERDALKERLAKVREWAESGAEYADPDCLTVLAILEEQS